jgi:hypothetical protein
MTKRQGLMVAIALVVAASCGGGGDDDKGTARRQTTSWIDRSGLNGDRVYGAAVGTSGRYVVGLAGADADLPLAEGVAPPPGTDMIVNRTGFVGDPVVA